MFKGTINPLDGSYQDEYEKFVTEFALKEVSAEEIGVVIARMAAHYMKYNLRMVRALKMYNNVKKDIYGQIDMSTGKQVTASKAEVLSSATEAGHTYEEARAHVDIINQLINALKALQRGTLNEYAHQI